MESDRRIDRHRHRSASVHPLVDISGIIRRSEILEVDELGSLVTAYGVGENVRVVP